MTDFDLPKVTLYRPSAAATRRRRDSETNGDEHANVFVHDSFDAAPAMNNSKEVVEETTTVAPVSFYKPSLAKRTVSREEGTAFHGNIFRELDEEKESQGSFAASKRVPRNLDEEVLNTVDDQTNSGALNLPEVLLYKADPDAQRRRRGAEPKRGDEQGLGQNFGEDWRGDAGVGVHAATRGREEDIDALLAPASQKVAETAFYKRSEYKRSTSESGTAFCPVFQAQEQAKDAEEEAPTFHRESAESWRAHAEPKKAEPEPVVDEREPTLAEYTKIDWFRPTAGKPKNREDTLEARNGIQLFAEDWHAHDAKVEHYEQEEKPVQSGPFFADRLNMKKPWEKDDEESSRKRVGSDFSTLQALNAAAGNSLGW